MSQLILQMGERHYPIQARGVRIGRAYGNNIVLSDPQVSARHAVIWFQAGQAYIRDENSSNGTYVNQQRLQHAQPLGMGDKIQVGNTVLTVAMGEVTQSGGYAWLWAVLGGVVVILIAAILLITVPSTPSVPFATPQVISQPTVIPLAPEERARLATVQILDSSEALGSGGIIDPRGYILTNYHVVEGQNQVYIGVNGPRQDEPPEVTYQAELVDWDADLDLALLRIVADENGYTLGGALALTSVPLGDSDRLKLGDPIIILGFPGLGGETLTLSRGTVAGFHKDDLGNSRGWIKTDAEASPGNSGGVAINQAGEWIGVPTWVNAEERTLGRISVLRAINLARPLLQGVP